MAPPTGRLVSTLWTLGWNGDSLSCVVYRGTAGQLEMRLESESKIILSEPFEMRPRALARVRALRRSLERRGWRPQPAD
jgi:hypothetical protein